MPPQGKDTILEVLANGSCSGLDDDKVDMLLSARPNEVCFYSYMWEPSVVCGAGKRENEFSVKRAKCSFLERRGAMRCVQGGCV